jgi:plasmid stability protein
MSVNLSIKNVPDDLAERLRRRAERSHRSLQGELMAILEATVAGPEPLTSREALRIVRGMGLETAPDAAALVRADRDAR